VKTRFLCLVALPLAGMVAVSCHVKREGNPTGSGTEISQVIKFENITVSIPVLIRIPDATQEFELGVGETRTVQAHSAEGSTLFYVEIFEYRPGQDLNTARRWTGYVTVGKVVTIRQRISIQIEIHD
jgi:hypothetical protein